MSAVIHAKLVVKHSYILFSVTIASFVSSCVTKHIPSEVTLPLLLWDARAVKDFMTTVRLTGFGVKQTKIKATGLRF